MPPVLLNSRENISHTVKPERPSHPLPPKQHTTSNKYHTNLPQLPPTTILQTTTTKPHTAARKPQIFFGASSPSYIQIPGGMQGLYKTTTTTTQPRRRWPAQLSKKNRRQGRWLLKHEHKKPPPNLPLSFPNHLIQDISCASIPFPHPLM